MRSVCSSWLQPGVLWPRQTHTNLALMYAWPCMTLAITSHSCIDSLFCCGVRVRNLCWSFQECCYNALLSGPDLLTNPNCGVSIASQNDGKNRACHCNFWMLLQILIAVVCAKYVIILSTLRVFIFLYSDTSCQLPTFNTGACCIAVGCTDLEGFLRRLLIALSFGSKITLYLRWWQSHSFDVR